MFVKKERKFQEKQQFNKGKFGRAIMVLAILVSVALVAACGGGGDGGNNPSQTPGTAGSPNGEAGGSEGTGSNSSTGSTAGHVGDSVAYEIIGIDPGAGLMASTREAMEEYGLSDWTLVESSDAAMTAALKRAYSKQDPIIITGWTPHWMFSSFDLKYLDDPLNVYGGDEQIHTLVRLGLGEDQPSAYQVLDNFYWTPADMEAVMLLIEDGMDEEAASAQWLAENPDKLAAWTDGVAAVNGDRLNIAYVAWSSEIASTNVVARALESIGYRVNLQQLEAGGMFAGVSGGSSDALVAAWLPTTHESFYEKFNRDFEDLGPNLDGTRIGLVVPTYMNISSIEDLQ